MRKFIMFGMLLVFMAGCGSEYYWNEKSQRCYERLNPGADVIVHSALCGR